MCYLDDNKIQREPRVLPGIYLPNVCLLNILLEEQFFSFPWANIKMPANKGVAQNAMQLLGAK